MIAVEPNPPGLNKWGNPIPDPIVFCGIAMEPHEPATSDPKEEWETTNSEQDWRMFVRHTNDNWAVWYHEGDDYEGPFHESVSAGSLLGLEIEFRNEMRERIAVLRERFGL